MTSLAGSPTESSRSNLADILERCIALVAVVFALWIAWYIVSRLNVGLDVSDSAYYIISYAMHRDIESQSTLAGWLWASISPFDGVLANRYFSVVFLLICFGVLALEGWRNSSDRLVGTTIALAFALSGSLVYYLHWLPDPSYNLLNLGFIALGWAGLFGLLHTSAHGERAIAEIAWTVVIGFAVAAVFLAKPTSAALLGPALVAAYLVFAWRSLHIRRITVLALTALGGLALPFLAMACIGESPMRVFSTMRNGFDAGITIAPPSLNPIQPFVNYLSHSLKEPLFREWHTWAGAIAIVLVLSGSLSAKLRLNMLARVSVCIVVAISFPLLVWRSGALTQPDSAINALVTLASALAIGGIFLAPRDRRQSLTLFCGAMIASLFIYTYGTGNRWEYVIVSAPGFACVTLGVVASALRGFDRVLLAIPGLGILSVLLMGTASGIEQHPYRLSAPLSGLKSPARVGPFEETFLDSPKQAVFYNRLADIRPLVKQLPERPYLLDLSGRVPMVAFQIGAKAPRTPWLLSAYPGSTSLFDLIVGKISKAELAHAWVFQARDYDAHFPDSILEKYDLNFPTDYVPLTTVPIEYLGVEGTLYAPAGALKVIDIKSLGEQSQ